MGRPSTYTPQIGEKIAQLIAQDSTYEQIASVLGVPSGTIWNWLLKEPAFAEACAGARNAQAETIDNKMAIITEKLENGVIEPDVARVMLSSLQWRASKKNPRVYGDKTILSNDPDNPIGTLAIRLDSAIGQRKTVDITPEPKTIEHKPRIDDGSDLI